MLKACFTLSIIALGAAAATAVTPVGESVYHNVSVIEPDSVELFALDPDAVANIFEARASLPATKFSLRDGARWGLVWGDYPTEYYSVTLQHCATGFDEQAAPFIETVISHTSAGQTEMVKSTDLYERHDVDPRSGAPNTVQVVADTGSGLTEVLVGSRKLYTVGETSWSYAGGLKSWGIATFGEPLTVYSASTEILRSPAPGLHTRFSSIDDLESYFAAHHSGLEGFWEYLDRANDPELALPGGRYTLALIAAPDGGYDIIYAGGADVNSSDWHPGMLRGHLSSTQFANHFILRWIDAEMRVIDTDLYADFSTGSILSLQFPLYSTTLRFVRK